MAHSRLGPEDQLLKSSLLCGMKPEQSPVYRLQLFFIANKDLGSRSHQSDLQRALETGVDARGFWRNYEVRGSGEYILTTLGYETAHTRFGEVSQRYVPTRASDFRCRISGVVEGVAVEIRFRGRTNPSISIDGSLAPSAKAACRAIENRAGLSLPTKGDSAVRVLYNMAVDYGFDFHWG